MRKPKLLQTTPQGGTIHSYDIEGGKHTFERFLACQEGSCVFHSSMEDAKNHLILKRALLSLNFDKNV